MMDEQRSVAIREKQDCICWLMAFHYATVQSSTTQRQVGLLYSHYTVQWLERQSDVRAGATLA